MQPLVSVHGGCGREEPLLLPDTKGHAEVWPLTLPKKPGYVPGEGFLFLLKPLHGDWAWDMMWTGLGSPALGPPCEGAQSELQKALPDVLIPYTAAALSKPLLPTSSTALHPGVSSMGLAISWAPKGMGCAGCGPCNA